MTFKSLRFVLIILNVNVLCLSERQSNCSCVSFNWNPFNFSFLPEGDQYWKNTVCNITNCLQRANSLLLQSNASCKRNPINVIFPFISEYPWPNITFKMLPRPVLAIKELSSSNASPVLNALGQIWKLFAFCLLAAALSGIIIWFFDHKANSGHFPKSFWSGIYEGLWWAIVTMTTTGYGDKTPKSVLARVYAALWMITGLLLMSLITAQVSSTITADELRPLNDVFGHKVGVPKGSKKFFEKNAYGAESVTEYSTEKELLESLKNGSEDQIWLFECEHEADFNFTIVDVLDEAPDIGVQIKMPNTRESRNFAGILAQLIDQMLDEYYYYNQCDYDDGDESENPCVDTPDGEDPDSRSCDGERNGNVEIPECLKSLAEKINGNEDYRYRNPDKRCFQLHSRGKSRQSIKWTTVKQMDLVDYFLCGSAGLLLGLFIVGTLWDTCLRARHGNKTTGDVEDNGSVEIDATEGAIEIRVIKEDYEGGKKT